MWRVSTGWAALHFFTIMTFLILYNCTATPKDSTHQKWDYVNKHRKPNTSYTILLQEKASFLKFQVDRDCAGKLCLPLASHPNLVRSLHGKKRYHFTGSLIHMQYTMLSSFKRANSSFFISENSTKCTTLCKSIYILL